MIGLLGGTFDPVHFGHLDVARAARQALGLDEVWMIPARVPPHRSPPHASAPHRFAMTAIAILGEAWLRVSDVEMETEGPSYTIDTLGRLEQRGVEARDICFITGADAFRDIASWKAHVELLSHCPFAVVSRPGLSALALQELLPGLTDRMVLAEAAGAPGPRAIVLVDADTSPVSSTGVRDAVRAGRPLAGLVPPAVAVHIERHRLYRSPNEVQS